MTRLDGKTVVLLGGDSEVGYAVAQRVIAAGGQVVLGGRTAAKLASAAARLGDSATWRIVDATDQDSLAAFFTALDRVDHLFISAASYQVGPSRPFESKLWGQHHAVSHAAHKLPPDGSVVLMSDSTGVRPPAPVPAHVTCDATTEGTDRGLASELAPVRVNVVAPDENPRTGRQEQHHGDTLLDRVGSKSEVADTVIYLFRNTSTTRSTLYPDGSFTVRYP